MKATKTVTKFALTGSVILFLIAVIAPATRAKDEKLNAAQVIEKHLASIGPMDKLKEVKNRGTAGDAHVDIHVGGQANLTGNGNLISDGKQLRLSFKYPALQYPGEQIAFDGKDTMIGMIQPGVRSQLGTYLFQNDYLVKDGLLFGTLTTGWVFSNIEGKGLKLDVSGPKKMDGKSVYELKYVPRKAVANVTAFFYFDAETFRHVRSQFKAEVVPTSTDQKISDSAETIRYTITENFSDFKEVDGLTLPHMYKMEFSVDSPRGGYVSSYDYAIKQIVHNQPVDAKVFSPK